MPPPKNPGGSLLFLLFAFVWSWSWTEGVDPVSVERLVEVIAGSQNDMCLFAVWWKSRERYRGCALTNWAAEATVHLCKIPVKGWGTLHFNSLHQNRQFCENYPQFVSSASLSVWAIWFSSLNPSRPSAVGLFSFAWFRLWQSSLTQPFYFIISPKLN